MKLIDWLANDLGLHPTDVAQAFRLMPAAGLVLVGLWAGMALLYAVAP